MQIRINPIFPAVSDPGNVRPASTAAENRPRQREDGVMNLDVIGKNPQPAAECCRAGGGGTCCSAS